mgnify:FL=1
MDTVFADPTSHLDDLAAFVTASPTSYHAAQSIALRLVDAGFNPVDERARFPQGAGRFFAVRHGAVFAWRQPERIGDTTGLRIIEAVTTRATRAALHHQLSH